MELSNIIIACNSKAEYEEILRPVLNELGVIWRSGKSLYSPCAVSWDDGYPKLVIEPGNKLTRASRSYEPGGYITHSVEAFISAFDALEIEPLPSDLGSLFE